MQDDNNEILHLETCNLWDLQKILAQNAHFNAETQWTISKIAELGN